MKRTFEEFLEMKITKKELTALKAVYYMAEKNKRLQQGGTWISDVHNLENCDKISFFEALQIVSNMLYRYDDMRQ